MTRILRDAILQQPVDSHFNIETARYMIHHVFLPPQLPQKDDCAPCLDASLVDMILSSLQKFRSLYGCSCAIDAVASMVHNFRTVHNESGHVIQVRLEETLAQLSKDGTFNCTALQYTQLTR